jgi:hypothetical protein
MSNNFSFYNMGRIGNDECGLSQTALQDVESANYMLTNYFAADCTMKNALEKALSQPSINFTGSHQTGMGGCNIDVNSMLSVDQEATHPACRVSLFHRPFATVPFLGRGEPHPELESELQQGDVAKNRKTINHMMEKSFIPYSNTPLVPSIAATISNPVNLVEGVAADGWVRGGVPSRELTKDPKYFEKK